MSPNQGPGLYSECSIWLAAEVCMRKWQPLPVVVVQSAILINGEVRLQVSRNENDIVIGASSA